MDEKISKVARAYLQVIGLVPIEEKKKMDPVDPEELKGTHSQRKDKDIDNDGDVDKSDEYLHKRRQAISKAMKKESNATVGAAINRAEKSRQSAIGKAKAWMKRTGKSAEDAVREFDLFKSDISKLKEEAETVNGVDLEEKVREPYAVGTAQAMKITGDKPPLKKSTIKLAHKMAKGIMKNEEAQEVSEVSIIKHGRKFNNLQRFDTDKEANNFLEKNPSHGVIHTDKGGVYVAHKKNKGMPVKESKAPGATANLEPKDDTRDTHDKQLSTRKGEKDFISQHKIDAPEFLDAEKVNAKTFKDFTKDIKVSKKRWNDQDVGDKKPVKR